MKQQHTATGRRVLGDAAQFTARMDLATFLLEMRRLCEKACRDGGAE